MKYRKTTNRRVRPPKQRTAIVTVAAVAWMWLERVHTATFLAEVSRSGFAVAAWRFAESSAGQTLLLLAILAGIVACWIKLRERL